MQQVVQYSSINSLPFLLLVVLQYKSFPKEMPVHILLYLVGSTTVTCSSSSVPLAAEHDFLIRIS